MKLLKYLGMACLATALVFGGPRQAEKLNNEIECSAYVYSARDGIVTIALGDNLYSFYGYGYQEGEQIWVNYDPENQAITDACHM